MVYLSTSYYFKAVFHKFYIVHSYILWTIFFWKFYESREISISSNQVARNFHSFMTKAVII